MIKYNNSTISNWNFGDDNIIKVYRNNAVCYYKITGGGDTPTAQTPCFAVVDDISQYQDTEFVDVFNKADGKWYKLNNLNQYEEYGLYGSGRTITTYEGKLTVDDGYEYIYSGGSWNNVGEVSGSTATLPNVPFMLNYNAKNYDASTYTLLKESGQTRDVDAVCNYGYHIVDHSSDGYISVTGNSRMLISGTTYMGRNNTETGCTMTIVSKVRTTSGYSILTNRKYDGDYLNWMWRYPSNGIFLHGSSSYNNPLYFTTTTSTPIIASIKTYYDNGVKQQLNDWTNNGSYSGNFQYGTVYNGDSSLFCDYVNFNSEFWQGDFYWVYMSHEVLTDEQIQQVINYNEGGGGEPTYPLYYNEKQDPPNNVSFSSMTEAESYECPWVGMYATIDGDKYIFSGDSTSGYEWVLKPSRLPSGYTELVYCVVPRVKPTTLFTVPYECQPNYKYTTEFTPLNFWSTSYYGGIAGYSDSNGKDYEYLILKLDNGWGDQFNRFVIKFQNYEWDTRSSGTVPRAFTFYQNVRAKITLHLNNYSSGQGAVLTVENEGYTTYSNTRTQVSDSSWQITYGVKDLNLLNDNSTNDYCANMNFHNFKVEDNLGNLIYDYIPVKRESDNKVGLYDIVNQQFFYPTSFTLTAGPSV